MAGPLPLGVPVCYAGLVATRLFRLGFGVGILLLAAACTRGGNGPTVGGAAPEPPASQQAVALPRPEPDWKALTGPGCTAHRDHLQAARRAHPDLAADFEGTWALCALVSGQPGAARTVLERMDRDAPATRHWQALSAWADWLEAAPRGDRPVWPRYGRSALEPLVARLAQAEVTAPWAFTALVADPGLWTWREPEVATLHQALDETQLRRLAGAQLAAGLRPEAWQTLRALWTRLGIQDPVADWARWQGAGWNPQGWVEFARFTFVLREYGASAAAGEQAFRAGNGEGLLWWGRATARQGRMRDAGRIWEQHLDRVRGSWVEAAVTYRLGLVAESADDQAAAERWYLRAAALRVDHEDRIESGFRAGWLAWLDGRADEAARRWEAELSRSQDIVGERRVRYWYARTATGAVAAAAVESLRRNAPLSYYAWLLGNDGHAPPVITWTTTLDDATHAAVARNLESAGRAYRLGLAEPAVDRLWAAWETTTDDTAALAILQLAQVWGEVRPSLQRFWTRFDARLRDQAPRLDRDIWTTLHPRPWPGIVQAAARRHGVDPHLVWAVMREESMFVPDALSPVGARGLLQLMPATAAQVAARVGRVVPDDEALYDPDLNIELGTAYLAEMLRRYEGNVFRVLASYNAGPAAVDRWLARDPGREDAAWVEDIPFTETRNYVRKVLRSYIRYQMLDAAGETPPVHDPATQTTR